MVGSWGVRTVAVAMAHTSVATDNGDVRSEEAGGGRDRVWMEVMRERRMDPGAAPLARPETGYPILFPL